MTPQRLLSWLITQLPTSEMFSAGDTRVKGTWVELVCDRIAPVFEAAITDVKGLSGSG